MLNKEGQYIILYEISKKFKNPAGALTGEISTANPTFGVDENGHIYYRS